MNNILNIEKFLPQEPKYRLSQVREAIFKKLITNWDQATTLSKTLRETLAENVSLDIPAELNFSDDKKTIKALITLSDETSIEAVLMKHGGGRNTVCVSTQVGCPLNCAFCATGQGGFKRNLTTEEIINQVLFFNRYLLAKEERVGNVVFMGMGEPLLNYENVVRAIKILNDKAFFEIGWRHISISTAGIIPGIKKLANEDLPINLALSLHASNNKLRKKLMPISKEFELEDVLLEMLKYYQKTKRRLMFEYIMINEINDSPRQADELIKVLNILPTSAYFINLIPYNSTNNSQFTASPKNSIERFKHLLEQHRISVTQRFRFGDSIGGACGQLAASRKK